MLCTEWAEECYVGWRWRSQNVVMRKLEDDMMYLASDQDRLKFKI
jgi:hypothetical protein